MAEPRLASYIKKQVSAGYDINTIREFLIRNGYDIREVNEAIDFIYKTPKKKFPMLAVVAGTIGLILIIIILLFAFGGGEEEAFESIISDIPSESLEIVSPEVDESPVGVETVGIETPSETPTGAEIIELKCPTSCND
ncbi:MAG: hypothetical protein V3V78_05305, partial [Candidatus Woesearchaeota archaeon]